MKSAIKTIEKELRQLRIELKSWSKPRNFSQEALDDINVEIKEHEAALKLLKNE